MARADKNKSAYKIGSLNGDFLCDQATDGKAEHIDLIEAKRLDEGNRVRAHFLETGRNLAGTTGNARIIEQNHFAFLGQTVGHGGVPVIHCSQIMLIEDKWDASPVAEAAIGETDAFGFRKLSGGGLVGMVAHDHVLLLKLPMMP